MEQGIDFFDRRRVIAGRKQDMLPTRRKHAAPDGAAFATVVLRFQDTHVCKAELFQQWYRPICRPVVGDNELPGKAQAGHMGRYCADGRERYGFPRYTPE